MKLKRALVTAASRLATSTLYFHLLAVDQKHLPKVLIEIGDLPIIVQVIIKLVNVDIDHIIITLGFGASLIKDAIEKHFPIKDRKFVIEYVELKKSWQLGHASSILSAQNTVGTEPFLLCTADHLIPTQLLKRMTVVDFDESKPYDAQVLLDKNISDKDGLLPVTAVTCKLKEGGICEQIGRNMVTYDAVEAGVYAFQSSIFTFLEKLASCNMYFTLAQGVDLLIQNKGNVTGVFVDGMEWFGIETSASIDKANWFFTTINLNEDGITKDTKSSSEATNDSLYGAGDILEVGEIATPIVRECVLTFRVTLQFEDIDSVASTVKDGITVRVVGDGTLGNWDTKDSIPMKLINNIWEGRIRVRGGQRYEYKYLVYLGSRLFQWESMQENRHVFAAGKESCIEDGSILIRKDKSRYDKKELESDCVTSTLNDSGWLVEDYELRIKFGGWTKSSHIVQMIGDSMGMINELSHLNIKVIPGSDADLNVKGCDDVLKIYTVVADELKNLTCAIEISSDVNPQTSFKGKIFVTPSLIQMKATDGLSWNSSITTPFAIIDSTGNILGEIIAEVLVITPFIHPANTLWTTMTNIVHPVAFDIGHRGDGLSIRKDENQNVNRSAVSENTILSFQTAAEKGVHFVEFDVQLSKDDIPCLYHDFSIGMHIGESYVHIPINNLTAQELMDLDFSTKEDGDFGIIEGLRNMIKKENRVNMKERSLSEGDLTSLTRDTNGDNTIETIEEPADSPVVKEKIGKEKKQKKRNADWAIHDRLCLLSELFEKLPSHVAFNIEIKYPNKEQLNTGDCAHNRNFYVDTILKCIFDHNSKQRAILFSSFDANVCLLVSMKQPCYPVFFLTDSGSNPHIDSRLFSYENAVEWAVYCRLKGVVAYFSESIRDGLEAFVELAHSNGLLLFTYGEINNDKLESERQKKMGVDGVIADRIINHSVETIKTVYYHSSTSS